VLAGSCGWSTSERYMLVLARLNLPPTRTISSLVEMTATCPRWFCLALSSSRACDDWTPAVEVESGRVNGLQPLAGSTK
jgi:hypothetical protein